MTACCGLVARFLPAALRRLCRLQPAKTVLTTPIRDLAQLVSVRVDRLLHPHGLGADAAPMRAELFSTEQLQRHARELAGWHVVDRRPDGYALLRRLDDNAEVLSQAHELVREGVAAHRRIAPAAEWLLDNYYLIEDQIRTTRRHLPRGYSRLLPRLANGPHLGLPRVYAIATELISHTDGRVDIADLNRFTASYQSAASLTLGELWAIPIMLRLALTENLRRVAVRICDSHRACDAASQWFARLLAGKNPTELVMTVADLVQDDPDLSPAFVAEFARRVQDQNPSLSFATVWIEQRLAENHQNIEQMVLADHQGQAADQVSIGNSITSLRTLSAIDWREFVEGISAVEAILRGDPAGVYGRMDFATRDSYRHAVEALARRSHRPEDTVASVVVALAAASPPGPGADPRRHHVGYYLIDAGRSELSRLVGTGPTLGMRLAASGQWLRLGLYLGPMALLTALVVAVMLALALASGWHATDRLLPLWLVLIAAPIAIAASQTALACVNWLTTRLVHPALLPRLDFRPGIPAGCATLVVIPTMLATVGDGEALADGLEVRYLGNPDPLLHFALLTDFADAAQETMPDDEAVVESACAAITALNHKYHLVRPGIFHLFHRPRRWNPQERRWMGEERKRGKLCDLNRLLRHGDGGSFMRVVGEAAQLAGIAYVITLDTDTQLPREEACRLVGTIAHPLNRAVYDERSRRVVSGHGVLQPRAAISLPSTERSWFARIFAGESGIDPYTRTVSDVYQDVFGEGSFIGKGIYDLAAFDTATAGRFPDNAILSHDLIEGCYARSGLVSDVLLVEDQPARYLADVARRHRWMRGDWQILYWALPWVPAPAVTAGASPARWVANPLPALSRWKILDNLRRCLVPQALLVLLAAGWTLLPGQAWWWTALVLVLLMLPVALSAAVGLIRRNPETPWWMHLRTWTETVVHGLAMAGSSLVLLPFEAFIASDAACRSLWRMLLSHRHRLAWQTSSDAERSARADLPGIYAAMWFAPVVAVAVVWLVLERRPDAAPATLPLCVLWALSPVLAWWLSRPLAPALPALSGDDHAFLGRLARRTWRFFETFVTAEDHWLPPDNYQEYALAAVAHRTSPTNVGLALLGDLAARDFGFLTIGQLIGRCEQTTATMLAMERHHGHFYNWYDTRTLQPLHPRYISTVDSGNLAAHLMVLRSGMGELERLPLAPSRMLAGLQHTARCLAEAVARQEHVAEDPPRPDGDNGLLRELLDASALRPATLTTAATQLALLLALAERFAASPAAVAAEPRWWSDALVRECRAQRDELALLAPWSDMPSPPVWRSSDLGLRGLIDEVQDRLPELDTGTRLGAIAAFASGLLPAIDVAIGGLATTAQPGSAASLAWLGGLRQRLLEAVELATQLLARAERLGQICSELADVDLSFLYDRTRKLFAIGFNVSDNRLDRSYYDLLASEARMGSFAAIAQGKVAQDHWFALGRQLTVSGSSTALLSWSGSMFEYLMPQLVMPAYPETLLTLSNQAVVRRQIEYGGQRGVPWGISESGYNRTDAQLTYQYRAFGVPGLGLKRGLADDLVIAPYASALGLMIEPVAACANLRQLAAAGIEGPYGLYEAVDYTPLRMPEGVAVQTVQSYMAHHQGMSLLALAHLLLGQPMQRRFMADAQFKATLLLLQERPLRATAVIQPHASEASTTIRAGGENEAAMRVFSDPDAPLPEVHLLSNGRYHVMVGAAGGGCSRWKETAVNRWRGDPASEAFGMFCYLRDTGSGAVWSNTHQPTLRPCPTYEAIFTQARAEFRRRDHDIDVHTQISVSPEDDIELRRITLTNRSRGERVIELTSFAEVVDAPQAADASHPAFSNLFVHTGIDRPHKAILCSRRARSAGEHPAWLFHLMTLSGNEVGEASYETDRMRFIGRDRSVAAPAAMDPDGALSGTAGSVLDPAVAIRRSVRLMPDEEVDIDLIFGMAASREQAEMLIGKYHDQRLCERVFGLSWTHSQVVLRQLGASEAEAQLYGRLAGAIIHPLALRRAPASVLVRNRRSQAGLWAYGISGDLPIVLLRIADGEHLELVRELLKAHVYWRAKGLIVDLVIWNEDHSVYRQALHDQIAALVACGSDVALVDRPGGIFVRRSEQMTEEDRVLLQTVARMVIGDSDGTLAHFADRRARADILPPRLAPSRPHRPSPASPAELPPDLICGNGLGGFTRDGREYIIALENGASTPLPWVNVLANADFGSVISASGSAYTWAGNAHEYRLTPWHNDAVGDPSGEAFYLRDEESGRFWSPSPAPARGDGRYVVRHGFGYSAFVHQEDGLACEMMVYVAVDAPVKVISITVRNHSRRRRRLSLTGYWEWVLGEQRQQSAMHIVSELDHTSGILTARNPYHAECGSRLVFVDVSERNRSVTGDRGEFLGRNGSLAAPAALGRQRLSGRVGAGLDPCAALQAAFELADDEVREIVFTVGAAEGIAQARQLAQRHCAVEGSRKTLEEVWRHWNRTLGSVHVETPDPTVNILANGWLIYQTIACRMWARSGFYQSGGAFGFRDQLQDAMALTQVAPWLLREHLLRAAAHQFREGDVQHWWHPPGGRGVRTHFSDDFLWLPCAVARYCLATGDTGVLDEVVPFIEGRAVRADEEAYYDKPGPGPAATLYEHCVQAINHGLRWGAHGLPLMGCGDWNDGMNLVGAGGKGESVWLGFFLHDVLEQFARVAQGRGDTLFAGRCADEAAGLKLRIEANAWDGAWYRRAYFDDGTPLGSASNAECQIDSLPQSWAVLSGVGDLMRVRGAMEEVDRRLVSRSEGLIRLFTPAFDRSGLDPGYIKGYAPGVRENGGQYTHAAIWTVMAFAKLGDHERAWELWSLINPVAKSASPQAMAVYQIEPYVVAADVYGMAPHVGRGGWSWYTGSAGWMYRLLSESLLGIHREAERLRFVPCLPAAWPGYTVHYRFRDTHYRIRVERCPVMTQRVLLDGVLLEGAWLPLTDDRRDHEGRVEVPE